MIAWGSLLSSEQILQIVNYIDGLPIDEVVAESGEPDEEETDQAATELAQEEEPTPELEPEEISFTNDIFPIIENRCIDCHGSDGGWDSSTYELFMNTGDNAPVVIPGDPDGSLLAQKLLGTHSEGDTMPPPPLRSLNDALIQLFLDWIAAGAPE
jgi:mono/diheme cytochrome c family protein